MSHSLSLKFFCFEADSLFRRSVCDYQYTGRTFVSFTLRQSRLNTQKFEVMITSQSLYYDCKQNFNWVIGPLPNRADRNPTGSVEEVISRNNRRVRLTEKAMQNQPFQEVLCNFRQELLTLELNYEQQLRGFQRKLMIYLHDDHTSKIQQQRSNLQKSYSDGNSKRKLIRRKITLRHSA